MDTDVLVDDKIEDGATLIRRLIRHKFDVSVAFWVKVFEDSAWQFYVVSPSVDPLAQNLALRIVFAALDEIPDCSITPMDVMILPNTAPFARDALALRDRHPSREPKRYHGKPLGATVTAELLIYPRRFPMKVRQLPDRAWQVLIAEPDDLWLTCDSEEDARAIAAAPVLEYEPLPELKAGQQSIGALEKTADALAKYRMSFGSRFLAHSAQ